MRYVFLAQLFYLRVRRPFKKTDAHPSADPILLASALPSARLSREQALSWVP